MNSVTQELTRMKQLEQNAKSLFKISGVTTLVLILIGISMIQYDQSVQLQSVLTIAFTSIGSGIICAISFTITTSVKHSLLQIELVNDYLLPEMNEKIDSLETKITKRH